MIKALARITLLALFLPLLLNANYILKNNLLNPAAENYVEKIAEELHDKTGVNGYLVATNEHFPERFNLVAYSKKFEDNMSKPYVLFLFAPFALITEKSQQRGRVAIIPSSREVATMLNKGDIMDATIDVIAGMDQNKIEDKHAIGVVQGFSEMADQIAKAKGVTLKNTIKETRQGLWVIKVMVLFGSAIVFWLFLIRPLYIRIRNGKEK
jgi:hypothetical protein